MKVTSAILTTMSGSLGGAVAATARGGIQYFRKRIVPHNPRTFLQTAIRSAVSSVSALWQNILTEEQQQAWWDIAEGTQQGKTVFAKVNQPRVYANNTNRTDVDGGGSPGTTISPILTPPESSAGPSQGFTAVIDASANTLAITGIEDDAPFSVGASGPAPAVMYIYISGPQASSRFSRQHPYQLVLAVVFPAPTDGAVIPNVDLAALGIPTVTGRICYVKVVVQTFDGRVGVPIEDRVEITA